MWQGQLRKVAATEKRIKALPGTKPIRQMTYRAGAQKRKAIEQKLNDIFEKGVID